MPVKKKIQKSVKNVDKKSKKIDLHEITIRMENAENKVEECYKKMNKH